MNEKIAREVAAAQKEGIAPEIISEAQELCRGAEVLPEGILGLSRKLAEVKKAGRMLRVKLGVDPTSSDLHLGHAVVFRKLRRFQEFGHQIVLIIGGFTARIGDPTGRNSTRPALTKEQVDANAQTYLDQMGLILDMSKTEVVNNHDWLAPLSLNDVIRLASTVTANQLIAKEQFGSRLEKQQPVSLHELFYPLLQAYDSVAIKADIELGGTDQRFNILQGRELQPNYDLAPQLALLLPLLEGTDGVKKMSKTYDNFIGLKESPENMFGKAMRIPDELILKYFEFATTLTGPEIDAIEAAHLKAGGNPKDAKLKLAAQIVSQYHGPEIGQKALADWNKVHSEGQAPEDMPSHTVQEPTAIFRVMVDGKLIAGTGEAKRLVQEGGVKLDGQVIKDPNHQIKPEDIKGGEGEGMILQVGRRKFVRLV